MSSNSLTIRQLVANPELPRLEAHLLMARVVQQRREWLLAHDDESLTPAQFDAWRALVERRVSGEPMAYILGEREFYGRAFECSPKVLIPRPETETLVSWALGFLRPRERPRFMDVGTGSGCIAVTLCAELANCTGVATDVSAAALAVARANARRLLGGAEDGVARALSPHPSPSGGGELNSASPSQIEFIESHWFDEIPKDWHGQFDLIVSNPPYIAANDPHLRQGDLRFEPQGALTDQGDGARAYRVLAKQSGHWLKPGGALALEHGYAQGSTVRALLTNERWSRVETLRDDNGHERVTVGIRPPLT